MRTLIVTHYFPPEIGAPQARLSELARYWADAGDEVTVLTGMPNHPTGVIPVAYRGRFRVEEEVDGYRIVRTWLYATANEGIAKKTLGHLSFMVTAVGLGWRRTGPADVVVVSSPTFFAIFSAWVLARMKRARLVVEVRDLWPAIFVELGILRNRWIIRALEALELWAYREADAIVVVSEGFRDDLTRRSVPASRVHVIRNGVDLERFAPGPIGDVGVTRSRLGAGPDDCLVLYLGAHGISQGLVSVAEAVAKLQGEPIHVAFVGEGAAKADLAQRVDELGLTNVSMLAGVRRDEVPAVLAAADICLVPLRDVPLFSTFIPSKIFEYLGAGKAVIGAVRGEAAAILAEAGALVVEPEDPAALAHAVRDLARDPVRRRAMGDDGRVHVESNFDRRALAARYRGLLSPIETVPVERDGLEAAQNLHFGERSGTWSDRYQSTPSFQARLAVVGSAVEEALAKTPGGQVLDFGGGTGIFSMVAAECSSFVVCLDRSEAMLAEGRDRAELPVGADGMRSTLPASRIAWLAGDDRCLAAGASPFDLILAVAVLEYVCDVESLLTNFSQQLHCRGQILVTVPNTRSALRLAQRHARGAFALTAKMMGSRRFADQSYLRLRPHGDNVPWKHAATSAGLDIADIRPIPLATSGLRSFCRPNLLVSLRHPTSLDG